MDLATDDLRAKLLPASRKLKEIEKERDERRKVRKRTKQVSGPSPESLAGTAVGGPIGPAGDVEMPDVESLAESAAHAEEKAKDNDASPGNEEDEFSCRKREAEDLSKLIDNDVKNDIGASPTGLYELVG